MILELMLAGEEWSAFSRTGVTEVLEGEDKGSCYLAAFGGNVVAALFIVPELCVWEGDVLWWTQHAAISDCAKDRHTLEAIFAKVVEEAAKHGVNYVRVQEGSYANDFVKLSQLAGVPSLYDIYEDELFPAET